MKKYTYGICLILLLLAGCVFLEGIDQPSSAKAGEDVTITMHTRVDVADGGRSNVRLIIGFLAPKSWAAATNSTITYTTSSYGNGRMVVVPASNTSGGKIWPEALKDRFGMGGN